MKIGIIGSGALGCFYGGKLAHAGYDVHFLMRQDYQTVKKNGLQIRSYQGDFLIKPAQVYCRPNDMPELDCVLIGLKTTANASYQELLTPVMTPHTVALTAQNGLGNEEKLAELFGPGCVAGGLAFLCSNRVAPGIIEHLDYGHIHIGNYQRGIDAKLQELSNMFNHSGINCTPVENLALSRWKKLVWNVPFNGLSTLLDKTVDKIVSDPALKQRSLRLMREVQTAANAYNFIIENNFLDLMMTNTINMKPYYTSMHLDRRAGRPIELESIIGEPLRRAKHQGLTLPEMQALYDGLKSYA